MKLKVNFQGLENLVLRMGATPVSWQTNPDKITDFELEGLRAVSGLELTDINQIVPDDNGVLTYKGIPFILYIRDVQTDKYTVLNKPEDTRRFHICDCGTLEQMRTEKRFNRYRQTTNTSGVFLVDAFRSKKSKRTEEIEARLLACKNCLSIIKFQGYDKPYGIPDRIWKSFDVGEFLKNYKTTFRSKPRYTDRVGPDSDYPEDWEQISQKIKSRAGWRCMESECGVNLNNFHHRRLLHVHHRDGNKGNVGPLNLIPLCLGCHSKMPKHARLINPRREDLEILKRIKIEQGITP